MISDLSAAERASNLLVPHSVDRNDPVMSSDVIENCITAFKNSDRDIIVSFLKFSSIHRVRKKIIDRNADLCLEDDKHIIVPPGLDMWSAYERLSTNNRQLLKNAKIIAACRPTG